jgi:hypothetical protein
LEERWILRNLEDRDQGGPYREGGEAQDGGGQAEWEGRKEKGVKRRSLPEVGAAEGSDQKLRPMRTREAER